MNVGEVAALLEADDPVEHLRRQHRLLHDRLERTRAMVAAVEKEMEARQMGINLTSEERFEVFGEHDPARHEAEVTERWGDTDAYAQSRRRSAAYTMEDWARIKIEGEELMRRMAEALRSGVAPDSAAGRRLVEEHRQQICRNHYDCSRDMHADLGRMHVEDERFTATFEQVAPGLAQWVSTAVQANAARSAPSTTEA